MIGIDLLKINKIEKLKKKEKFIKRVFTQKELAYLEQKNFSNQTIAGIFAAKEAVSKVFGTGIGAKLSFKDIEILHENNAPFINIQKEGIKKLLKEYGCKGIGISISHDEGYCVAVAEAWDLSEDLTFNGSAQVRDLSDNFRLNKEMACLLPKRNEDFHKYDYGNVLVIGGKKGMHGSVTLACMASMRTGAGLTHLLIPDSIENQVNNWLLETIVHTYKSDEEGEFADFDEEEFVDFVKKFDAIAFGPGIGRKKPAKKMLKLLLTFHHGSLVVDADGINLLADMDFSKKQNIYVTSHQMEFSRLTGLSLEEIKKDRIKSCKIFIKNHPINLLLKGKNSVVLNNEEIYVNDSGSSALATAGSGDSLTGILVALLGRKDHIDMLKLATYIHGLCGDYASLDLGEDSVIASDIIRYLPRVMKDLRKEERNDSKNKNQ